MWQPSLRRFRIFRNRPQQESLTQLAAWGLSLAPEYREHGYPRQAQRDAGRLRNLRDTKSNKIGLEIGKAARGGRRVQRARVVAVRTAAQTTHRDGIDGFGPFHHIAPLIVRAVRADRQFVLIGNGAVIGDADRVTVVEEVGVVANLVNFIRRPSSDQEPTGHTHGN